jgi:hypothetical protein
MSWEPIKIKVEGQGEYGSFDASRDFSFEVSAIGVEISIDGGLHGSTRVIILHEEIEKLYQKMKQIEKEDEE